MTAMDLIDALEHLRWEHYIIHSGASTIVTLTRGARILGLFPDQDAQNLLWINPRLTGAGRAKPDYWEGEHGWNIGGDRTWISPELEYNVGDPKEPFGSYVVQRALDPGNYHTESVSRERIQLQQIATLFAHRSRREVHVQVTKTIHPTIDPVANSDLPDPPRAYAFGGYETLISVSVLKSSPRIPVAVWNLLQVPAVGHVIVPTYGAGKAHVFFGNLAEPIAYTESGCLQVPLGRGSRTKVSIKAAHVVGRIGHVRHDHYGRSSMVIRQFSVFAGGSYGDVWADNPEDQGHCVQCYDDGGVLGAFGELEYHSPLLRCPGSDTLIDQSQVWAYSGSHEIIAWLGNLLLGETVGSDQSDSIVGRKET